MGTAAAPNLVVTIIDFTTGNPDTGETVEIVPYGSVYPTNKVTLSEIGVTGRYKKETGSGVAAVAEGSWQIYVGGVFRGIYLHGGSYIDAHHANVSDPHGVSGAQVALSDAGGYFTNNVEDALQEVGASLAGKAGTGTAVLLDASTQSVNSGKPKIINLNADKVDGYHVGSIAGKIPLLGASGATRINLTLLGKKVGTGNDNIPQISTDVTPEAGKIHDTLLGKEVGGGNLHLPQITIAWEYSGRLSSGYLGTPAPHTGLLNLTDTPAPDVFGAVTVYVDGTIPDNTDHIVLDDKSNWLDRWVFVRGYVRYGASPANYVPGGSADQLIRGYLNADGEMVDMIAGCFYSEAGGANPYTTYDPGAGDEIRIGVSAGGDLEIYKAGTASGSLIAFGLEITCSPAQNHLP